MSLKVLLILSLVAAAAASPAPTLPILLPGLNLPILKIGGSTLGNVIGSLFHNVVGAHQTAKTSLDAILNLSIKSFDDVITFGVKVVLALGDIINSSIHGLGDLIVKIVACTLKIIVCFLGIPGPYSICTNNWNTQFGVAASAAFDVQALIKVYGLTGCYGKVQSLISIYTRGLGVGKVRGSLSVVLNIALDFSKRIDFVIGGGSLAKADFTLCYRKIATLLGAIGNSHKAGLGLDIVNNFVPSCNRYIVAAGYPDFGNWDGIKVDIGIGNNDNAPWAIVNVNAGVNLGIGQLIGNIFKGVIGVTRLAVNLIHDIAGIVLNTIDDVFYLAVKILLGIGGALDSVIVGLGSLVVRIVGALLKIVLCHLGGSGKYGVCSSGWNKQFGISGDATTIDGVIELYGVGNCVSDVNVYINSYTNGKGISSTSGSIKIMLQTCVSLAQIVEAKKWDKSVVVVIFRYVTYLFGSIGNSNSKGVGTAVCNKFIPACNKILSDNGFTGLGNDQDSIIQIIESANEDDYLWSADIGDNKQGTGFVIGAGVSVGGSVGGSGTVGGSGGVGVSLGGAIGGLLGGIFKGIRGITAFAGNLLQDIINIKINALKDVFTLFWKLSLGIGGTVNTLVSGLGLLFSRIVAVILKIGICIHGFPGDRSICTSQWNSQFGINGDANTIVDLLILFKVNKARADIANYISIYTKLKGAPTGSAKIIFDQCNSLAAYITVSGSVSVQITKEIITNTFLSVTTISACIANANKKDSGKQITQQVIPTCGRYFKQEGYPDITTKTTTIEVIISAANGDSIDYSKGSGGDSGNGDSQGSGDSGNGGTQGSGDYGNGGTQGSGDSGNGGTQGSGDSGNGGTQGSGDSGNGGTQGSGDSGNGGTQGSGDSGNGGTQGSGDSGNGGTQGSGDSGNGGTQGSGDSGNGGTQGSGDSGNGGTEGSGDYGNGGTQGSGDSGNGGTQGSGDYGNGGTQGSGDSGNGGTQGSGDSGNGGTQGSGDSGNGGTQGSGDSGNGGTQGSGDSGNGGTQGSGDSGSGSVGGSVSGGGSVSVNLGGIIGGILKGIAGVTKLAFNIINEIISIKINVFADLIILLTRLVLAIGGIIDASIIGLGSLIARIFAVILKIGFCVHGYSSESGICTKEYNALFGITGDASTQVDLIALFRLTNVQADIDGFVSSCTGGKGIDSVSGSLKIILQIAVNFGGLVTAKTFTRDSVSVAITGAITVAGGIFNANNKGSGTDIVQKLVPVCGGYLKKQGFSDISTTQQTVITNINIANDDIINWKTAGQVSVSQSAVVVQGDGLVTNVKDLFKNVNTGKQNTVTAVLNLDVPRNIGGVFNFAIKVTQGLGYIIDLFISGLGSLLVRVVGFILRYVVCVLGISKHSNSFVCQKAYYDIFGVSVSGNTWADIALGFKLNNAKSDLDAILNKYTNNKGLGSLKGSTRICFDQGYALIDIFNKKTAIVEADLTLVLKSCTILIGGFANSWSTDYGKQICGAMVPVCSTYLEQNNYPSLSTESASIYASISVANSISAPWTQNVTV